MKKSFVTIIAVILMFVSIAVIAVTLTGCRQADRVAYNISKEADSFSVTRKLTVMNVRSDKIIMEVVGTFSIANNTANELEIICMVGPNQYKKHFVYLNQWTVYTVEDISGADVDPYKYEIIFNPEMLMPVAVDVQ